MKKKKLFVIISATIATLALGTFVVALNNLGKAEDFCYYNQTLVFNAEQNVLEGKETVGFFNYSDSVLGKVCLHLYPNAFRNGAKAKVVSMANEVKAFPNGKSYGDISIESVNMGLESLNFSICGEDENILEIDLGKEVFPNDLVEFEVGFSVKLANINHRLGYGDNTINLCNYYPILCVFENGAFVQDLYHSNGDPFYSKIANYKVSITYPNTLTLASSGEQVLNADGEFTTATITANKVRDFAMVLSDKFEKLCDTFDDVKLNYYFYDDSNSEQTMQVIKNVLKMNQKYGNYPYDTLSVCKANFVHGGMEYPNLVLISDDIADFDSYVNVVVHELCHQWWYGVVGNNQYTFGFLDEGLTDFNTALYYDEYNVNNHSSEEIFANATKMYVNFEKIYSSAMDDFSSGMIRRLDEFSTENEYVYLTYVKGMLMFANLNEILGTKKMTKCLSYYFECNKFKEATPDDLIDAFNKASGKNLTSFFTSWFDGKVVIKSIN